ncbi:sulfite exporter TauE/SafE family protein [bacterium]|nr:sulfite exporter TauE/SafE family protein [bacterium]
MIDPQTIAILLILFVSTFVTSALGFGIGMIAMPLLALIVDVKTAAPLLAMVTGTMTGIYLATHRHEIDFKSVWRLILSSLPGIPIGLLLLKGGNDSVMKAFLALIIIAFAAYSLFGQTRHTIKSDWPAFGFGFMTGIASGAYNMGGPPLIIFGALKEWPASTFRATIFSIFFPNSILLVSGHFASGLVTESVTRYYLMSLPILIFSIITGGKLTNKIPADRFNRIIQVCLLIIGSILIIRQFY